MFFINLGLTGAVKVPFLDFGEIVDTKLRSHAKKEGVIYKLSVDIVLIYLPFA